MKRIRIEADVDERGKILGGTIEEIVSVPAPAPDPAPPRPAPTPDTSPGAVIFQSNLVDGMDPLHAFGAGNSYRKRENARCWVEGGMMHVPYNGNYGADWRIPLPAGLEECYLRYLIRFESGFEVGQGGKLPGFGAIGDGNKGGYGGGGNKNGDAWSCRGGYILNKSRTSPYGVMNGLPLVRFYSYHLGINLYGESLPWREGEGSGGNAPYFPNQGHLSGFDGTFQPGRLYEVQMRLSAGGEGATKPGAVEAWVNGHRVFVNHDIAYRKGRRSPYIEMAWLAFYHGGLASAPPNHEISIGNVTVSREPIAHGLTEDPRDGAPVPLPQEPEPDMPTGETKRFKVLDSTTDEIPVGAEVTLEELAAVEPPDPDPEPTLWPLDVIEGTGSGNYEAGDTVQVSANAAQPGFQFKEWTGGTGLIDDINAAAATLTMPAVNVTITAVYEEVVVEPPVDPPEPGSGWDERPNTKLESVVVPWADPRTQGNPINLSRAWSGGAHDTIADILRIWGGGHADYSGNEMYGFDVGSETWARETEPSDWNGDPSNGANAIVHADGAPISSHSRDNVVFNDTLNATLVCGPPDLWRNSHGSPATFAYRPGPQPWTRMQDTTAGGRGATGVDAAGNTCLASESNDHFGVMAVDGSWAYYPINGDPKLNWQIAGVVDRHRNVFIVAGKGETWEADMGNLAAGLNRVGSCPWTNPPGLVYVPSLQQVVGWGGGQPYTYNGAAWTEMAGSGPSPDSLGAYGVYGRLGYSEAKHALVYCGLINQNVWLYRF